MNVRQQETKTSNRVINVPPTLMNDLKEYKAHQAENRLKFGDKWKQSEKVFTTEDGSPLNPATASSYYRKLALKHGLTNIKLHGLRHTNATFMIANGTDIKTVSKRLGHANITTTGNIYTHAIQSADERAAAMLNDIFAKKKA